MNKSLQKHFALSCAVVLFSNQGLAVRLISLCVIATNLLLPSLAFSEADVVKHAVEAELAKMAGTLSIHSQPLLGEGKLVGCSLVFSALQQDWTYRKGPSFE